MGIENIYMVPQKKGEWDELGDWDGHIYTTMYKIDNYCKSTIQHQEIYSMLCGDLNEKEIQKEGTYVNTQQVHFAMQQKLTQHCKETILP